ncbi:MAG: DUF1294 domain-containing protein [Undibacterium sp.]
MTLIQFIAIFLGAAVNIFAFSLMGWDKHRARMNGAERISEGFLFFLAIIGGSVGVFLGMFAFRHKTRTISFLIGIPLAGLQNIILVRTIIQWLAAH